MNTDSFGRTRFQKVDETFRAIAAMAALAATLQAASAQSFVSEHDDRLPPPEDIHAALSPDWHESALAKTAEDAPVAAADLANVATSAQQRRGALSGKIVFMNAGHGWTHDPDFTPPWRLQRGITQGMNEDYGNLDQLNFFAAYCFNAGATVVSMRPLGHQTNEVILDNDDPGVTFAGPWSNSTSPIFWGSPGDVPYRYASFASTQTATATYTPNIPVAGFYPVYCWTRNGSDRGDQLYRIRHTGGETLIRIPHHMVGNGWIYLGEYYFNAGANMALGSVVISNLRETPTGSVVIADAIRFGNGMGSVDQGGGVSGYPREDENMRYWVRANLGQGQSTSLYNGSGDDESDSWSAPGKMSAEMNREQAGDMHDRIHIAFHSNCCNSRGCVGLITGDETPNQPLLAQIGGQEVNTDLRATPGLEHPWSTRTTYTFTGGYGEISSSYYNDEMDATILEVGFHDVQDDAELMRDAKVRAAIGKAAMHAAIKFLNQVDNDDPPPLAFLPDAPTNPRAVSGANGQITLAWSAPVEIAGSQNPTNYLIYRSTNGYGFGNPVSVGNVTSFTITNLAPNIDYYFRITASNAGGESMPSEVVGCRAPSVSDAPRVLVVNGFDRFDRTLNLRQNVGAQNWDRPGNSGSIERVFPRWNNSFDYVVQHGKSISAAGYAFDSCQNEAVISGQVLLNNYRFVIWACGNETTDTETFSSIEQIRVASYLASGGSLFVSGANIANDLDRASGPTTADRNFLHNQFHASFVSDNSSSYTGTSVASGIFAGRANVTVDNGNRGIYWVQSPDVIAPFGTGATAAMNYSGVASGAAAIQYDGSAGGGRVVLFGFPFETITDATRRNQYMSDVLEFLSGPPQNNAPPSIYSQPRSQSVSYGSSVTFSVFASGTFPFTYQWRFNGTNIAGANSNFYTAEHLTTDDSGAYTVVITNSFGSVTSQVATLFVAAPIPAHINVQPQGQLVTKGSDATLFVTATGTEPLTYQWRFNGAELPGTTSSSLDLNNAQPFNSGNYQVVVSNPFGSTTSLVALVEVALPTTFQTVYLDNFDSNTAGNWAVNSSSTDTRVTFNYNYATNGIPSAPNSTGGTTRGIKFEANMVSPGEAAAINASPIGQSFPGDMRLHFDLWINANGPFPAGGTGSTEHGTAGVGTAGNRVHWTNATSNADGFWFAVDGEGQAGTGTLNDFGAFSGTTYHAADSGVYSAGTSSTSRSHTDPYYAEVFPGGQSAPTLQKSSYPQQTGTLAVGTIGFAWRDVIISKIGNTVEWSIDGLKVATISNANATANNIFIGYWDSFNSISDNAALSFGLFDNVRVERFLTNVPPYITSQPVAQNLWNGDNATFSVTAGGTAALKYQWRFNGVNIPGATNSSYTRLDLTTSDAGNYSVVVTNTSGSVTSASALLTVTDPVPPRFDGTFAQNGNELKFTLTGEPGLGITILKSADLINWQVVTNLANPTGTAEFATPISPEEPQQFYRARLGQ